MLVVQDQLQRQVKSTAMELDDAREASERITRTITNLGEQIRTCTAEKAEKAAMTDAIRTLEADLAQQKKDSSQITSELDESRQATTRAISECQSKNRDLLKSSSETLQETASRLLKADEEGPEACVGRRSSDQVF